VDLRYGYLVIPAETAYYFENTGDRPLDIDYVGILP
jgi:mannose-6-phosphate isomerase-like protein (cupin superfamily)